MMPQCDIISIMIVIILLTKVAYTTTVNVGPHYRQVHASARALEPFPLTGCPAAKIGLVLKEAAAAGKTAHCSGLRGARHKLKFEGLQDMDINIIFVYEKFKHIRRAHIQNCFNSQPTWRRPDAQCPLTDTLIQSFRPFSSPLAFLWPIIPQFLKPPCFPSCRPTSRQTSQRLL